MMNQFSFKKGKDTRDTIFMLNETVNYLLYNKLFDHLHHGALDKINRQVIVLKLMKKHSPIYLIQIILM